MKSLPSFTCVSFCWASNIFTRTISSLGISSLKTSLSIWRVTSASRISVLRRKSASRRDRTLFAVPQSIWVQRCFKASMATTEGSTSFALECFYTRCWPGFRHFTTRSIRECFTRSWVCTPTLTYFTCQFRSETWCLSFSRKTQAIGLSQYKRSRAILGLTASTGMQSLPRSWSRRWSQIYSSATSKRSASTCPLTLMKI